jgi:3-oxoacyl-ACP reductase-like protein
LAEAACQAATTQPGPATTIAILPPFVAAAGSQPPFQIAIKAINVESVFIFVKSKKKIKKIKTLRPVHPWVVCYRIEVRALWAFRLQGP